MNKDKLQFDILYESKVTEDAPYTLDTSPVIYYHLHKIGGACGYEILEKIVTFNDNAHCGYVEEDVSCWEVLDMDSFVESNFRRLGVGDTISFTVRLTFSYHKDYYGEVDSEWEGELL